MARTAAVASALALLVAVSQASWVLTQPYTDFPLLDTNFAATGMQIADDTSKPAGSVSTTRLAAVNFGDVPCNFDQDCTDPAVSRGASSAADAAAGGVYAITLNDQSCVMLRWNTSYAASTPTYLGFRVLANKYLSKTRLGLQFNFYNDQPGSLSFRVAATNSTAFNMNTLNQMAVPYASNDTADATPAWSSTPYFTAAIGTPTSPDSPAGYYYLEVSCDGCSGALSDAVALCNIVARGTNNTFDAPPVENPPVVCAALEEAFVDWTNSTTNLFIQRTSTILHVAASSITVNSVGTGPVAPGNHPTTLVCFQTFGLPWYTVIDTLASLDSDDPSYWVVYEVYRQDNPQFLTFYGISPGGVAGIIIGILFLTGLIVASIIYWRERKNRGSGGPNAVRMEDL